MQKKTSTVKNRLLASSFISHPLLSFAHPLKWILINGKISLSSVSRPFEEKHPLFRNTASPCDILTDMMYAPRSCKTHISPYPQYTKIWWLSGYKMSVASSSILLRYMSNNLRCMISHWSNEIFFAKISHNNKKLSLIMW